MRLMRSACIALSMYTRLPVPQFSWEEEDMQYAICFFPLAGVLTGALLYGWLFAAERLGLPSAARCIIASLLPLLLTGGIHADGFMDTSDALQSWGGRERRLEILKDPHLGAFAAIRLGVYFVASLSLWCALPEVSLYSLMGIYGLSRCLSGIALTSFPIRPGNGLARTFAQTAERTRVRRILIFMALVFAGFLGIGGGFLCAVAAVMVFLKYRMICEKDFGGLSGDLAGWFVQTAELWMLGMLVLSRYAGGLL